MAKLFPENSVCVGADDKCYLQFWVLKNSTSNPSELPRVNQSRVCHPDIYVSIFLKHNEFSARIMKKICANFSKFSFFKKNVSCSAGAESTTFSHIWDRLFVAMVRADTKSLKCLQNFCLWFVLPWWIFFDFACAWCSAYLVSL